MDAAASRKVQRARWQREIVGHLEQLPRQYAALESAMAAFGGDFDLARFKQAFETDEDMEAYNRVQAVERALGRVQNFVGELAVSGVARRAAAALRRGPWIGGAPRVRVVA